MPADVRTRDAVMQHLEWDSPIDAAAIGVTARDHVVTLTGFVNSYAEKLAAERAAKRVSGVRAVANDIQVRVRFERTDEEIAADVGRALELRETVPPSVQAVVDNGHLTLTGTVAMMFHRVVAEKAVRHVRGLKGIVNRIVVVPAADRKDVRREIARALHREATLAGHRIDVDVHRHVATLRGTMNSWHEREAAEQAAMHAPGIVAVQNNIELAWQALDRDESD